MSSFPHFFNAVSRWATAFKLVHVGVDRIRLVHDRLPTAYHFVRSAIVPSLDLAMNIDIKVLSVCFYRDLAFGMVKATFELASVDSADLQNANSVVGPLARAKKVIIGDNFSAGLVVLAFTIVCVDEYGRIRKPRS